MAAVRALRVGDEAGGGLLAVALAILIARNWETASRADFRDIIMVHGEDPYAWKGVEDISDLGLRMCKALEEKV